MKIKDAKLSDIFIVPLEFKVKTITSTAGVNHETDGISLHNERFDIDLYMYDEEFEEFVKEKADGSKVE